MHAVGILFLNDVTKTTTQECQTVGEEGVRGMAGLVQWPAPPFGVYYDPDRFDHSDTCLMT